MPWCLQAVPTARGHWPQGQSSAKQVMPLLQTGTLEVAIPSSRGFLPNSGVEPVSLYISWIGRRVLYH